MTVQWLDAPVLPGWIRERFPFRRKLVSLSGRKIHFVDDGDGPPVLLLHGNPTWSFLWRKVIYRLRQERVRVIAPDMLGLGLSAKPRKIIDHSMELQVGALCELVQALQLDSITISGQDMGGPVVTGFTARNPDRVRAAMFCNTAFLEPRHYRTTPFHRLAQTPLISDLLFRGLNFPVPFMNFTQGDKKSISAEAMRAYRYPLAKPADRIAPLAMARMVPNSDKHPSVAILREADRWANHFRGPVSLVWGMNDPILGKAVHRIKKTLPQATCRETTGGHFLQEEFPEAIAEAILQVTLG